jgi:hypothetical protein
MSLFLATLITGLFLVILGFPLLLDISGVSAALKAIPRSPSAAWVFFGGGAVWFLDNIWHLSPADFGDFHVPLFLAFGAIAVLAFKCVPDFLAVRGVCVLVLLSAMPLLDAAYMEYDHPQRLFLVTLVYVCIVLALWTGAQPWRVRDFFSWLFARPVRSRGFGGFLTAYGLLLCGLAFTY